MTEAAVSTRRQREPLSLPTPPARTLHQRICAIVGILSPGIPATSRNQYKVAAIGIDDVEEALAPLLAEHGVMTEWTQGGPPTRDADGWMVHLRFRFVNADDKSDATEWGDWWETGSNVAAACSFGRKGALKAPFHLAAKEDEGTPAQPRANGTQHAPRAPQNGGERPARRPIPGHACQDCGGALVVLEGKYGPYVGHEDYDPDGCRWKPTKAQQQQWIAELEQQPEGPVQMAASAVERIRDFAGIDEDACRVILLHHGWDGESKSTDWVRTLTDTGALLRLVSDLNQAIRDAPNEIPT